MVSINALVVYYSRTGNTERIAKNIAGKLNCDIVEIVDKKKRTGIIGWIVAGMDATREKNTEIQRIDKDPSDYKVTIIGTPIWNRNITPAIRTYINENHEKINKVAFFFTYGGRGIERTDRKMREQSKQKPIATLNIKEREIKNKDYKGKIIQFIHSIDERI